MPGDLTLDQPLSWKQTAALLAPGGVAGLLLASGNTVLALGALLVTAAGWVVYVLVMRHRFPAGRRVLVEETVRLPWSCEVVWDLIKPAENAGVLHVEYRLGYKVPGTPDGLGEQQALEQHDGLTVIIEVVEYQHGRRAVTRLVSPPADRWFRQIQAVDPIEGGCEYTSGLEVELAAGRRTVPRIEEVRTQWREHLSLVEQALADADQGSASAGNLSANQAPVWPSPEPPAQS